jgi:hypothetical protein
MGSCSGECGNGLRFNPWSRHHVFWRGREILLDCRLSYCHKSQIVDISTFTYSLVQTREQVTALFDASARPNAVLFSSLCVLCAISAITAICALADALCASRTSSTSCTWGQICSLGTQPPRGTQVVKLLSVRAGIRPCNMSTYIL